VLRKAHKCWILTNGLAEKKITKEIIEMREILTDKIKITNSIKREIFHAHEK